MPPWGYYGGLPGGVGYSYGTAMPPTTMLTTNLSAVPMAVPQIRTSPPPLAAAPHRGVKRSAEQLSPTFSRESNAPRRKLMQVKHLCDEEWAASLQVNFRTELEPALSSSPCRESFRFFAPSWAPGFVPRNSLPASFPAGCLRGPTGPRHPQPRDQSPHSRTKRRQFQYAAQWPLYAGNVAIFSFGHGDRTPVAVASPGLFCISLSFSHTNDAHRLHLISLYVQHASGSVFDRLVVRGTENVDRSTAIMTRIRKGVSEDDKTTHPCFIVSRADSKRSSPFQIQVREG